MPTVPRCKLRPPQPCRTVVQTWGWHTRSSTQASNISDDRMFKPSKHESALARTGTRQFGLDMPTIDGGFMSSFGYSTGTSRPMLRLRTALTVYEVSMHDRWRTPSHVCLLPVQPDLMIRSCRSAAVESYTSRGINGNSGLSICLRMSIAISAAVVSVSDVKRQARRTRTITCAMRRKSCVPKAGLRLP